MKAQSVPLEQALGLRLAYDLSGIIPGREKGAVLRRGHVLAAADLEVLRAIGKSHVKTLELEPGEVHEDDAAFRLATALSGAGLEVRMPGEAWADVHASRRGLLRVACGRLSAINQLADILVATRQDALPVTVGERLARAKVVGLTVVEEQLLAAEGIAAAEPPVLQVLPFRRLEAGLIITGRELADGRVDDAFGPLIRRRLAEYGSRVRWSRVVADDPEAIAAAVREAIHRRAGLVLVTGGMSPDDETPEGIRRAGVEVVFRGAPVSPGAMTLLAYGGEVPVIGVPAGILARPRGLFDLLLPRILTGERLGPRDAVAYGHGGLCWNCGDCTFPACPFGRGG